jgi:hypothetical protein
MLINPIQFLKSLASEVVVDAVSVVEDVAGDIVVFIQNQNFDFDAPYLRPDTSIITP